MKIKNILVLLAITIINQTHCSAALRNFLSRISRQEFTQHNPTTRLSDWLKKHSVDELREMRQTEKAKFYDKTGNDLIAILGLGGPVALLEYAKSRPHFNHTPTLRTPGYEDFTGHPVE